MKIRDLRNLPLFCYPTAEIIGRVERAIVGDDYRLFSIVVELENGKMGMVKASDFEIGKDAVTINDPDCIKSYAHGEELSIYNKKMGDAVYNLEGRELGVISDFVVSPDDKNIEAVEVSAGALADFIEGRTLYSLDQVIWKSEKSLLVDEGQGGSRF